MVIRLDSFVAYLQNDVVLVSVALLGCVSKEHVCLMLDILSTF